MRDPVEIAFHIWLGIPESEIRGNLTLKNYIYHENPPGVVDDRPHKQDVLCHIGIFGLEDPSARNRPAIVQSVRAIFLKLGIGRIPGTLEERETLQLGLEL